ncbi:glycosyltransferase family 87 protein [Mesorhizobium marinum]|uniref:glycosyltransferase family 87 protein n=1 Tax=Mesorhizobium marinum TaxID=3228790 RepID=UPI0034658E4A
MTTDDFRPKTRLTLAAALLVFAFGVVPATTYHMNLWNLSADGLSEISGRLPYRDFSNLWAGARMALDGHVETLFDPDAYRATLRAMFSPDLPDQEWSYPPSMLLVGAPLALLPVLPAYLVWTFGTVFLLHLAIRPLRLPALLHAAALASPAVLFNAMFGQNGALTAALLIGGLLAVPKRPILAGVLFGLLTAKPHLGILVPFCLIASRNWRAFGSAAVTASALALATGVAFGFGVWPAFMSETRALMTAIMEAPYPQPYQRNALTVFIMARSFGAGLDVSYAAQAVATFAAIAAVTWLWMPSTPVDPRRRALITATLALVATPYGYTYDMIPTCVALAYLFATSARPLWPAYAIAWLFPLFAHLLNYRGIGIGVLVPISVAAALLAPTLSRRQGDPTWVNPDTRSERTRTVTSLPR